MNLTKMVMVVVAGIMPSFVAHAAETNAPAIKVPEGQESLVATQAMQDFLKTLRTLPTGATQASVLKALGEPTESNAVTWVYRLKEATGPESECFINAFLYFSTTGLSSGSLETGFRGWHGGA